MIYSLETNQICRYAAQLQCQCPACKKLSYQRSSVKPAGIHPLLNKNRMARKVIKTQKLIGDDQFAQAVAYKLTSICACPLHHC